MLKKGQLKRTANTANRNDIISWLDLREHGLLSLVGPNETPGWEYRRGYTHRDVGDSRLRFPSVPASSH